MSQEKGAPILCHGSENPRRLFLDFSSLRDVAGLTEDRIDKAIRLEHIHASVDLHRGARCQQLSWRALRKIRRRDRCGYLFASLAPRCLRSCLHETKKNGGTDGTIRIQEKADSCSGSYWRTSPVCGGNLHESRMVFHHRNWNGQTRGYLWLGKSAGSPAATDLRKNRKKRSVPVWEPKEIQEVLRSSGRLDKSHSRESWSFIPLS